MDIKRLAWSLCQEYQAVYGDSDGTNDLRVIVDTLLDERGPNGERPTVEEIHDIVVEAEEEAKAEREYGEED